MAMNWYQPKLSLSLLAVMENALDWNSSLSKKSSGAKGNFFWEAVSSCYKNMLCQALHLNRVILSHEFAIKKNLIKVNFSKKKGRKQ